MIDYDFPQTVSVPEDSPSRADPYELALVVCQRNADTALQAYRRVDEKAEKFMTFTAVVAAAIFAAMTKDQALAMTLLPSMMFFVVGIFLFVLARRTIEVYQPVDGKWTIEAAGTHDVELMRARIAATLYLQAKSWFSGASSKARLLDNGIYVMLAGFFFLAFAATVFATGLHVPDTHPASVAAP